MNSQICIEDSGFWISLNSFTYILYIFLRGSFFGLKDMSHGNIFSYCVNPR